MQHVLCSMATLRQSQAVFQRSVGGTPWKVTVKSVLDPSLCLGPSPSVFPSLWEDCSWRLSSSREGAWYGSCFDLPIGPFAIMIAFNLPCSFTVQANVSLNLQINQELKSVLPSTFIVCLTSALWSPHSPTLLLFTQKDTSEHPPSFSLFLLGLCPPLLGLPFPFLSPPAPPTPFYCVLTNFSLS